jgi:hypothetical protein
MIQIPIALIGMALYVLVGPLWLSAEAFGQRRYGLAAFVLIAYWLVWRAAT